MPSDESAIAALTAIAGRHFEQDPRDGVRIVDIRMGFAGEVNVQFIVTATGTRFGMLVPLPSLGDTYPWITEAVVTGEDWASAFTDWLDDTVDAPKFVDAKTVPYLELRDGAFKTK